MSALTDIFFGNIYITMGWAAVLVVVLVVRVFQYFTRHEYVVAQVSEVDHMGEFLTIDAEATSSTCIRTKNNRRFYRTSGGYLIKASRYKNYTMYFGKLGTGYAFEPDQEKEDRDLFDVLGSVLGPEFMNQLEADELKLIQESPFIFNEDSKVGTLYDALAHIWDEDLLKKLPPEHLKPLIDSQLYVTVELERGHTPEGYKPVSDEDITTDANKRMADLISMGVEGIRNEDWVKLIFAVAAGVGVTFMAQAIGLFTF
jgi:hypothetical protein